MRRISPGTVTVGVFAILLGLVATYVARRALESKPKPYTKPARAQYQIVVAQRNLPEATRIREPDVRLVRVAKDHVPKGALGNVNIARNRTVKTTVRAGQPILEDMLYPIGKGPTIEAALQPGYRAVTIAVTGTSPAGFVRPGSYVDIALTVEGTNPGLRDAFENSGIGGMVTKTLMRGVKVLEVGAEQAGLSRSPAVNRAASIVVEVLPEQAKRLILASRLGRLSVFLVSSQKSIDITDEPVEDDEILSFAELLNLPPVEVSQPYSVEQYRGTSRSVLILGPDLVRESREADEQPSPTDRVDTNPPRPRRVISSPASAPGPKAGSAAPKETPVGDANTPQVEAWIPTAGRSTSSSANVARGPRRDHPKGAHALSEPGRRGLQSWIQDRIWGTRTSNSIMERATAAATEKRLDRRTISLTGFDPTKAKSQQQDFRTTLSSLRGVREPLQKSTAVGARSVTRAPTGRMAN